MKEIINSLVNRIKTISLDYVTENITVEEKESRINTAIKTVYITLDSRNIERNRAIIDELRPNLSNNQLELVKKALYGNSII